MKRLLNEMGFLKGKGIRVDIRSNRRQKSESLYLTNINTCKLNYLHDIAALPKITLSHFLLINHMLYVKGKLDSSLL